MTRLRGLIGQRCVPRCVRLGSGPDPFAVLRAAAGLPGLVCLTGRWAGDGALIAAEPLVVLPDGADPYEALAEQPGGPRGADGVAGLDDLVGGGWFGWLGYDGRARLGFYDHVLRLSGGVWWFESLHTDPRAAALDAARDRFAGLLRAAGEPRPAPPRWRVGEFARPDAQRHLGAVERAVELIRAGEVYQVNVCTRMGASFAGDPAELHADVAAALAPDFAAYVAGGPTSVASLSPEEFLTRRGRAVRTSPIKGTRPRAPHDLRGAQELRASVKDAAENVMIVDLMRNDLGRVCETGSVRAGRLLEIEAHPGVWHLVSTVTGRLREEVSDGELLRATFPPGSVTGAPKARAVEAIADLEPVARGVYTGVIGFSSPCWGAQFNVAIRTFEITGETIELGVGGGITVDSVPSLEWQECLTKAAPLLSALGDHVFPAAARFTGSHPAQRGEKVIGSVLETVLTRDGVPLRLGDHLARLDRSARELYGLGVPAALGPRVRAAAADTTGRAVVRIVLAPDGSARLSAAPLGAAPLSCEARTVVRHGGLWRHKWADRGELAAAEEAAGRAVPLFVAPDGTVLETSRGNVFLLCDDGTLVTAPLRDDLLPGVTRRALLDLARDRGRATQLRPFGVDEMTQMAAFWTSSLSLAVPILAVDGVALPRRDREIAEFAARLVHPLWEA